MKFNEKPFDLIKVTKENAIIWGQKMWFILTDVYTNSKISKFREHNLWITNITLAVIYKEFTYVAELDKTGIDYTNLIKNLVYKWDDVVLIYLAGSNHFPFIDIENLDDSKRINVIQKLINLEKKNIFYSLVKHYTTVNAMYEELANSIKDENGKFSVDFDNFEAWEWAREEFFIFEID
ncbi:MAG: hypothetical protein JXL97_18350 [Bacteroidales bacterium]|nr:hypothetical protein [Bacteroidales bacterium]